MSVAKQRIRELEIAIRVAMEMCDSRNCTKQQVYETLAQAVDDRFDDSLDEDDAFCEEMDEKEYRLWFAQDEEKSVYAK